jgi:three-Cys-motif partner protein
VTKAGCEVRFDEIGYWSEVKLDIVKQYATAYSQILSNQSNLTHVYIDAFAGAGVHVSKATGEFVPGSPLNALAVKPPFKEVHLIDMDHARVENLKALTQGHPEVFLHEGNCNDVLLKTVFPRANYESYSRALCLLDPYGLTLDWKVLETAGKMKSIDLFLNFPIMDMNRNALWRDIKGTDTADVARMDAFWGDDSWKKAAYQSQGNLFGADDLVKKSGNLAVVKAFKERLQKVAGFKNVPDPIPMRNSIGAVVYYLFFASQKDVANRIVRHIFDTYKTRGGA